MKQHIIQFIELFKLNPIFVMGAAVAQSSASSVLCVWGGFPSEGEETKWGGGVLPASVLMLCSGSALRDSCCMSQRGSQSHRGVCPCVCHGLGLGASSAGQQNHFRIVAWWWTRWPLLELTSHVLERGWRCRRLPVLPFWCIFKLSACWVLFTSSTGSV